MRGGQWREARTPRWNSWPAPGMVVLALMAASQLCAQGTCKPVAIDAHRLYACREGRGQPAVVLEAGMRNDSRTWRVVAPRLAGHTTVVTYDRAGLGRSDHGPEPRTSRQIAGELRALLHRLDVQAPYVLVGHSIGGRHVRIYAVSFPDEVAGLVLLDSPHETFEAERLTLLTPEERDARRRALAESRATLPRGIQLEYAGIEVSEAPGMLPPVPLVVVAAGRHRWQPPATAAAHEAMWQSGQRRLARTSSRGQYRLLANAGHNFHLQQPDSVVALIVDLVRQVRAR